MSIILGNKYSSISAEQAITFPLKFNKSYSLHLATINDISSSIDFVMSSRKIMFPMLEQELPEDLIHFNDVFIKHALSCFLIVTDQQRIIATAAFKMYDHRFPHLTLDTKSCVEVVKLFVLPEYRRQGLAHYMFKHLKWIAIQRKIEMMYLHTHPFLSGAQQFWQQQGFHFLYQDDDPVWQTIHMSLDLKQSFNMLQQTYNRIAS